MVKSGSRDCYALFYNIKCAGKKTMNFKMAANNWLNGMTQVVRDIKRHDNKHKD